MAGGVDRTRCAVLRRDVRDLGPADLDGCGQVHLFAGVGGWPLALDLAGVPDLACWTASCPCPPFSVAGRKDCPGCGGGLAFYSGPESCIEHFGCWSCGFLDDRHLWPAVHRLVAERRPPVVLGEQVASSAGLVWLAGVRRDLEALGYAVGAADLCAAGVGAPHRRQRLFFVADVQHQRARTGDEGREGVARVGRGGLTDGREDGADADAGGERVRGGRRGDGAPADRAGRAARERQRVRSDAGDAGADREPERARSQGHGGDGDDRDEPGRHAACAHGSPAEAGPWSDFDIREFREPTSAGEWIVRHRRIEPGVEPLVDGLPADLVRGRDRCEAAVANTSEARVMRLKGYGNAIVPQLAAVFVRAWMGGTDD